METYLLTSPGPFPSGLVLKAQVLAPALWVGGTGCVSPSEKEPVSVLSPLSAHQPVIRGSGKEMAALEDEPCLWHSPLSERESGGLSRVRTGALGRKVLILLPWAGSFMRLQAFSRHSL